MSAHSRLKAIQIVGQRKAFYRHRIAESSFARTESVDIEILVKSSNGVREIMQSVRITSRPLQNKEVEPIKPVLNFLFEQSG